MGLEAFIWGWTNFHPVYSLKRAAKLIGLAAIILLPLLYLNVSFVKRGFSLSPPNLQIENGNSDQEMELDEP